MSTAGASLFSALTWFTIVDAAVAFIKYGSTIYPNDPAGNDANAVDTGVYLYDLHIKPRVVLPLFAYGLRFKTAFNLEY